MPPQAGGAAYPGDRPRGDMHWRWPAFIHRALVRPGAARLERAALVICVLGLLAWTTWLQMLVSLRVVEWDSHIWLLMGRWWLDGIWPYRDAWELKPPGIFLYLAGVFALLPEALWSVRVSHWLIACASTLVAFLFLRRQGDSLAALLGAGAWSYFSAHAYFVVGGIYTEQYAATGMWIACALAGAGWPVAAGAAVAGAAMFKHPAATVLLPAALLVGPRALPRLLLGVAVVACPIVAVAWLLPGMWQPFVECNWTALLSQGELTGQGMSGVARLAQFWNAFVSLVARFPLAVFFVLSGTAVAPVAALLWLFADLLGLMAQRNFYAHHWVLLFPSTIWIASVALRRPLIAALAVLALAMWLPGYWRTMEPQTRDAWGKWRTGDWPTATSRPFEDEVGHYVRAHTGPSDRIAVFGWNATGLGIYWSAERLPAIRHFYGLCCGVSQDMLLAEIEAHQPQAVVLVGVPSDSAVQTRLGRSYALGRSFSADYVAEVWLKRPDERRDEAVTRP